MTGTADQQRVFIALGSNLGDRRENLRRALAALDETGGLSIRQVSSIYETAPVDGPGGQQSYYNAVVEIVTDHDPAALLAVLQEIERRLGRTKTVRWGPRIIDLDLLLYGQTVRAAPDPILPHPRMHERGFVLVPLCELAPEVIHPVLGRRARELLAAIAKKTGVLAEYPPPTVGIPSTRTPYSSADSHDVASGTGRSGPVP